MGRERKTGDGKIPFGIEIRTWKNMKTLRIRFTYRGVECRETLSMEATPANLKYAERLRSEVINAIERDTFSYPEYFPNSKRAKRVFGHVTTQATIGELLKLFLEQTRRTLQPSTCIGYEKACRAHLFEAFGKIPVKELTPAYIRQWLSTLQLTAKSVRNILTPLRCVLDEAVNDDLIARNPLERVKLKKVLNKQTIKSAYEADPFDLNEIQAILEHSEGPMHNFFKFAFFTGLRPSEMIGLAWDDIDWINSVAHINRAVVAYQEKTTKTEAGQRNLMLLPPALEALQAQKAFTFLAGKRVFCHPKTGKAWDRDTQIRDNYWRRTLKKAGVRYRNPYQTRHTYASMMLTAGENMLWLAKQMGHRDTEMIIKTYGKWIPDPSIKTGYVPVNNWGKVLQVTCANLAF